MKYAHEISNLLAVLHRDGGHYEGEHGTRKALIDAIPAHYAYIDRESERLRKFYKEQDKGV